MFEQEINETIQRITRDVLQDKTLISLTDILNDPAIPNRFKAFFETEVHWWIYTDSLTRKRDRRFDFSHPEIASLLNYLEQIQVKHARYERDEFLSVLDRAVKLSYNYICRPQTTLKWYVFRGEPTKSLGETLLRMNAFVDYPYFRTVFIDWVDRKREERPTFDSISAREFERIIRRIDDQILLSFTIDDLLEIMAPLFDFIGKGEAKSVPIDALIVFFDDKHIGKLVEFLEKEKESKTHVTPDSFAVLMDELLNNAEEERDIDFSTVYQEDALDDVVRDHLQGADVPTTTSGEEATASSAQLSTTTAPPQPERSEELQEEVETETSTPAPPSSSFKVEKSESVEEEESRTAPKKTSAFLLSEEESKDKSEKQEETKDFFIGLEDLREEEPEEMLTDEVSSDDENVKTTHDPIIDILIEPAEDEQIIVGEHNIFSESDEKRTEEGDEEEENDAEDQPETREEEVEEPEKQEEEIAEEEEGEPEDSEEGQEEEEQKDEEESAADLDDVRLHIDAMLERKVVKKIFGRDREEYEQTLESLNDATSWREASRVLDELFIRFDVDPYSRTAIRFTDAVYGRYLTPVSGD